MASGSEADRVREHLQSSAEEKSAKEIDLGLEQLVVVGVGGVASKCEEDTARAGGAPEVDEILAFTQEERLPASAATVSEGLMKAIRSKPLWQVKVGNETIVKEYERAAIAQGLPKEIVEESLKHLQSEARRYLTSKEITSASTSSRTNPSAHPTSRRKVAASESDMQDLIDSLAALQANVPSMLKEPLEEAGCGVWVADNVVPWMLRDLLETSLDAIAEFPEKDFHPYSNSQVQNLIHPSLFPYIDGESPLRVEKSSLPPRKTEFQYWSRPYDGSKYQWLPSQFYVHASGSVQIRSNINNLEWSSNQELYKAIELLFGIFLPMFEKLLSPRQNLRGRELQVIVKAANYVLQPKGTAYEGTWHVEGMSHEQIIASGIYYYFTSPWLEDHGLEFRRARDEEKDWPQLMQYNIADYNDGSDDEEYYVDPETRQKNLEMLHKLTQDFRQNIYLGSVPTLQDRLIVFTNNLQHKVSKVANNSNLVGTRKMLVFFLVDPDVEIVSTKNVPEQQWGKMYPKLRSVLRQAAVEVAGKRLPLDIEHDILSRVKHGQGFTMAEAKRHRLVLMKERAAKVRDDNEEWESVYALCEH